MRAMAQVVDIGSPSDPRLADYVSLRDVELRTSLEAEHGLFLAEGEKVVRRAVEAGYPVRSLLMAPRWLNSLADVLDLAGDVPCYVAPPEVIEAVTGFHVHRGALASLRRRPLPPVAEVLSGSRRLVVLEDLVDHTNVGAVFRCAAALGVDGVLLSPRCADPLYRRAEGVDGHGLLAALCPDDGLVRRLGGAALGRFRAAGLDPGIRRRGPRGCVARPTGRARPRIGGRRALAAMAGRG
jgi:hypothetical protein